MSDFSHTIILPPPPQETKARRFQGSGHSSGPRLLTNFVTLREAAE